MSKLQRLYKSIERLSNDLSYANLSGWKLHFIHGDTIYDVERRTYKYISEHFAQLMPNKWVYIFSNDSCEKLKLLAVIERRELVLYLTHEYAMPAFFRQGLFSTAGQECSSHSFHLAIWFSERGSL
jgi:hypothetical protein